MSDAMNEISANPGYVLGLLNQALAASESHPDEAVRARAKARAARLRSALSGMLDGSIAVGSRAPVEGVPAWATLDVAKGGFATGGLLAGGPLLDHERARARATNDDVGSVRSRLNVHALSEAGQIELRSALESGRFRVDVPEEGALLVLAWLLSHDETERASELLETIAPFFDRLRFYPAPAERAVASSAVANVATVGEVVSRLRAIEANPRVAAMNEMLTVWNPLCDRFVSLFLETVEGGVPTLARDASGAVVRDAKGRPSIEGGWPCRRRPARWRELARSLLDEHTTQRARHTLCRKPDQPRENYARLRRLLAACPDDPAQLSARDVSELRTILATMNARRGAPGSPEHARLRDRQTRDAERPLHRDVAQALATRLLAVDPNGGLANVDGVTAPIEPGENGNATIRLRAVVPASLRAKVERAREASLDVLVERGIVPSGEVLARVSPQITAQVRAAGITDPSLQRLYAAVYAAFRRRRSLLLLNLERQTRLEDLPWIAVLEQHRRNDLGAVEQSRQTFGQLATIAFTAFPEAVVPNKLLQEFRALAKGAGMNVPLVDELAADIFMGTFSGKFLDAAKVAAHMLRGTLYERYFGVPFDRVLAMSDVRDGARTSAAFDSLCSELAGPRDTKRRWSAAANGVVIEQQQIVTTQNLASLFDALGLRTSLAPRLEEMARKCFTFIVRSYRQRVDKWHSQLLRVKNTAYAWRQMVFYLSLATDAERAAFVPWARELVTQRTPAFAARFEPAMRGLEIAIAGGDLTRVPSARRFTAWSVEKHWLL